jgi:NAD(P)-dependent dehydrogenase (short-subunit alcohol dehydrogenase family)
MSIKQLLDLTGKVALVTGGSRGLGLQMAEAFGEMGAKVALTARKTNELEEAQSHLKKMGIEAMIVPSDLSKPEAIEPLVDRVLAHYGAIDILVNNAGATWGAPAEEHPLDAWQKVINTNLTGIFLISQAVGKRAMIPKRKGKIINIASIAGLVGTDPRWMPTIAYNTSKGGVVNFTRSLAAEWAQYNINVNAIAPGVFPSKMSKDMIEHGGEMIISAIPMRRLGGPEELKGAAVLLASDASDYITGQTIAVDGGFVAV